MKSTLTNEQLIAKAKQWVKELCESGGRKWSLRVPVDFNHDPDVIFIELCNRLEEYAQHLKINSLTPPLWAINNKNMELKDVSAEIGKDWGQTKQRLAEMTSAFERRDDFIRWLVEIKLGDEYSLNELWDEYEKYEQSDETESE